MRNLHPADTGGTPTAAEAAERVASLRGAVERVIKGKPEAVRLAAVTLLAGGHLLVEDVPGVGKTTLAQALAQAIDCTFQRIQFTSDLLPSDVIGLSVYDERSRSFEFKHGPIFANIVLADEINRTTPSTVTCPSAIASRSADCVLGVVRLISSARTMLAKMGPCLNSNERLRSS